MESNRNNVNNYRATLRQSCHVLSTSLVVFQWKEIKRKISRMASNKRHNERKRWWENRTRLWKTRFKNAQASWLQTPCTGPDARQEQAPVHWVLLFRLQQRRLHHTENPHGCCPSWTYLLRRCNQWERRAFRGGPTGWLQSTCKK